MKSVIAVLAFVVLLAGCASLKQAQQDYKTGVEAPYEQGEATPHEQVQPVKDLIGLIPGGNAVATPVGMALVGVLTWMRGRRIRKQLPVSSNPITGFLGNKVGLEFIAQNISNVIAGISEVGPDGSPIKRAWKVGVSSLASLASVAVMVPQVAEYLAQNPQIIAAIAGGSAIFGGLEKAVSKVLPVEPPQG